ncbi:MAG: M23 family metallopeptidase [Bacteroidales bacterium]
MNFQRGIYICAFLFSLVLLEAQPNPYKNLQPITILESQNDSIDLARIYYKYLMPPEDNEFFSAISDDYESFDNQAIHYPRTDFSHKKDTTYLPLLLSADQKYVHPFNGIVTSRFGPRSRRYHKGTDVKLYTGDPIHAAFDGVVRVSVRNPSYGYLVIVRHYNGLETYYAHMSKLLVEADQPVKAGDLVGLGGNTGHSRGSHLHFEVRYLGAAINPEEVIDFKKYSLLQDTLYLTPQTFSYTKHVSKPAQARYHKIQKGETLSGIARKYRTTVATLAKLNKISTKTKIRAGNSIRVR